MKNVQSLFQKNVQKLTLVLFSTHKCLDILEHYNTKHGSTDYSIKTILDIQESEKSKSHIFSLKDKN
jgi:hypothetical protein